MCPERTATPSLTSRFHATMPDGARSRIGLIMASSTASIERSPESTRIASGAWQRGAVSRWLSRRSRSPSLTRSSSKSGTGSPSASSCCILRRTLVSREAVRKNLTVAWGSTTVPMSRPSSTAPGGWTARRRCNSIRPARTAGRAEILLAACELSGVRIALLTSSSWRYTQFDAPSKAKRMSSERAIEPSVVSSSRGTSLRVASSATER
mmetsp:Transcript_5520/g.14588  ORF Transcript_5520/g.14588 Transcript_5520/m.14588 type:complete len:209 (-) Transcript_5520:112-738(-)